MARPSLIRLYGLRFCREAHRIGRVKDAKSCRPICVGCQQVINNEVERMQSQCIRTIFSMPKLPNLPMPGVSGGKSQEYSERRLLGYSMEQMYEIVAQVDKYKEFVPHCKQSSVYNQRPGFLNCKLSVGFPPVVEERYISAVTLHKPYLVKSECTDGLLFNHLLTIWKFSPGPPDKPNTCILDFSVKFEFRNQFYSQLSSFFFDSVVKKMVGAFLQRAQQLHGPSSIKPQKPRILMKRS